ncbi:hypothetical protein LCGC14_0993420 [marine sediment metagenome]|uniref:Uncharacterized protein n=1 Tax=marine sediment metagenome TaxID=412755 RepID=A0A0F9RBJ6_9ZZZZ
MADTRVYDLDDKMSTLSTVAKQARRVLRIVRELQRHETDMIAESAPYENVVATIQGGCIGLAAIADKMLFDLDLWVRGRDYAPSIRAGTTWAVDFEFDVAAKTILVNIPGSAEVQPFRFFQATDQIRITNSEQDRRDYIEATGNSNEQEDGGTKGLNNDGIYRIASVDAPNQLITLNQALIWDNEDTAYHASEPVENRPDNDQQAWVTLYSRVY